MKLSQAVFLFVLFHVSWQKTTPSDPYYIAGVVEFAPFDTEESELTLLNDVMEMEKIIFHPDAEETDIIVFPEYILKEKVYTYVPDPEDKITPCDKLDYQYLLSEVSCYARSAKKYIVINLFEKVLCESGPKCSKDGIINYNTNVVFDRNGTVISRYRKTHLYYTEYEKATLKKPDLSTFTTDFGVTFGHFICFDLNFYTPAQQLADQGITDFVYPTYWFQEFPFQTALQLHQGWAHANNVNFLSAGGSYPFTQTTGSGIFAGKHGALKTIISEVPTRKILVAKVPKLKYNYKPLVLESKVFDSQEIPERKTGIQWKRDYNLDLMITELIEASTLKTEKKLCHNDFCCDFSIEKIKRFTERSHSTYEYRMVAYEGPGTFHRVETGEFGICALVACTNSKLSSCGRIFTDDVKTVANDFYFNKIQIKGSYKKREKILVMPSTVDSEFNPLPVDSYKYSKEEVGDLLEYEIKLTKPKVDILTFGLYGNYFVEKVSLHNSRPVEEKIRYRVEL
ncbi:BTD.2 family protein [Megaselia abdita]